ncbi:hypothetical protein PACTADRAFT_288 [Pachysolen tannophilus NRRL Y-2460]|uniref:Zn(2)-C6 fungal-type domain-containing protein n=1 Tax=Pachysolen tannophilus NRRL Y-2460 TaxID=669874 RepID=A0A1E4U1K5_PACTA|nr:hypothetical protein PACTADRAFT_288 [Pachysolen tannophilus NRRL Y-2460]
MSSNNKILTGQNVAHQRRSRISKACDYCRKKKVKCNGSSPCRSCTTSQVECTYTHVPKKRTPRVQKNSNAKTIKELENRLGNMESLMQKLVNKLEGSDKNLATGNSSGSNGNSNMVSEESDSSVESEDEVVDGDDYEDEYEEASGMSSDGIKHEESYATGHSTDLKLLSMTKDGHHISPTSNLNIATHLKRDSESNENKIPKSNSTTTEFFFDPNSSYSVFSPRGLQWIYSKTQDQDSIIPLQNLHQEMRESLKDDFRKWIEPIEKNSLVELPPRDLCEFLLSRVTNTALLDSSSLTVEAISAIFNNYYNFKSDKRRSAAQLKISYSDLLLMNSLIVLSAFFSQDLLRVGEDVEKFQKFNLTKEKLKEIEESYYINAIFYYQRISVIGDGLRALEAIIFLVIYVYTSLNAHASYLLISTLIRLAQELGLHRRESYYGLPPMEAKRRLLLWWKCYYLDRESSLRSGKPPVLNDEDISTFSPEDFKKFFLTFDPTQIENFDKFDFVRLMEKQELKAASQPEVEHDRIAEAAALNAKLLDLMNSKSESICDVFSSSLYYDLSRITSKAYKYLFCATALRGKTAVEVVKKITYLNDELYYWEKAIPDFMITEDFENNYLSWDKKDGYLCKVLSLKFSYYLHVMIINKIRVQIDLDEKGDSTFDELKDKSYNSVDLCLDAARNTLKLVTVFDNRLQIFLNWCLFFPFCGFLTLFCACIQDPNSKSARDDILLMYSTSKILFENVNVSQSCLIMFDNTFRSMLRIVVLFYDKNHPQDEIMNEEIREYLRPVQEKLERLKNEIEAKAKSKNHEKHNGTHHNNNSKSHHKSSPSSSSSTCSTPTLAMNSSNSTTSTVNSISKSGSNKNLKQIHLSPNPRLAKNLKMMKGDKNSPNSKQNGFFYDNTASNLFPPSSLSCNKVSWMDGSSALDADLSQIYSPIDAKNESNGAVGGLKSQVTGEPPEAAISPSISDSSKHEDNYSNGSMNQKSWMENFDVDDPLLLGIMEYQDNSFLYQNMFNLPNFVTGIDSQNQAINNLEFKD